MKKLLLLFSVMLLLVLAGCNKDEAIEPNNEATDKLTVYTTVYPLLYFTEKIGGDYVDAQTIYPNGADEHTYEPTQKEMIDIAKADLFFYIGQGLEGFVDKALETLKNEKVDFVATAEHLDLSEEAAHTDDHDHDGHNHGDFDPHVWLNPVMSIELAKEITVSLSEKLPEHKAYFESNLATLTEQLEALDNEFSTTLASLPKKQFIVTHAAYSYWERYGIEQVSISGMDSSSEPSQKKLQEIIELAKETNTKYVFIEQNTSSKLTETVKHEINGESLLLHNLSVLTEDDVKNNEDYFTLMRKNLANLAIALQ